MRYSSSTAAAAALLALPAVLAQTSTSCNPTNTTCPKDTALDASSYTWDFTSGASKSWSVAEGTTLTYGTNGAEFTISKEGEAPTIEFDSYIFFGKVEVELQAAPGTGIVSSIVLESDDLDEIDWELLGGDTTQVETNFFGKGNTTLYNRAIYYDVTTPQTEFHIYTVDWTSERIEWSIDGTVVRTLPYSDSLTLYGKNYPQTPMRVKMGNWCGGCSGEPAGTVTWAGGNTTFGDAPYVMYVKSVSITNYNPAEYYEYGNESGDWTSIELITDGKTSSASGGSDNSTSTDTATATSAPTSSISVATSQTGAAVKTTVTGTATGSSAGSTAATGSSSASASATSGSASTSSGAATQTGAASSLHAVAASGSLFGVFLAAFWLL